MGALTLKSFPFILRSWNVKSYESINPTDAFGQDTRVYVNKNQIVKIEPQFSDKTSQFWLTDKGRQFFDGIFGKSTAGMPELDNVLVKSAKQWENIFKIINKTFYVFNICNFKYASRYFFLIVFENINLEVLNFLSLISQVNSFVKVRRAEKFAADTSLETNFQINSATSISKLSASSLCLLIGTNPRYEGSYLNLKLRQRSRRGNFKILVLGSLVDLTFPASFLGSNSSVLKSISEGNHSFCKDIVNAENPMFVTNTETFKHSDMQKFLNSFKVLQYSNTLNKIWDGLNILNSSLPETGFYTFSRFSFLTLNDLTSFSSFYALNVNLNNVANIRTVMESRLLKYKNSKEFLSEKLFLNQSLNASSASFSKFTAFKKYLYLPNSTFFENQETFINTEGSRKIGSKLVFKKNTKSDWQLLRKLVQNSLLHQNLSCVKDGKVIFYDSKSLFYFKIFVNFHFQAIQNLTNLNDSVTKANQKFTLFNKFNTFKNVKVKLLDTKVKYWLDEFYTGGKETFYQNSLILSRCSGVLRLQGANFF